MDSIQDGNFEVLPDDAEIVPPLPSEDHVQAYVHHKRLALVKEMTVKGMPDDNHDRLVLLTALKDMDTSALGRKRIAADTQGGVENRAAAQVIAKILTQMPNNAKHTNSTVAGFLPPKLGAEVPPPELIEGETATHLPQQSYDTFMAKFPQPGETH